MKKEKQTPAPKDQEPKQQLYEDPKQPKKQEPAPGKKTTTKDQQEAGETQRLMQQTYGPQKKAQGVADVEPQENPASRRKKPGGKKTG